MEQLISSLHKAPQYKAVSSSASKLASVGISPLKSKPFRSGSLHSLKLKHLCQLPVGPKVQPAVSSISHDWLPVKPLSMLLLVNALLPLSICLLG